MNHFRSLMAALLSGLMLAGCASGTVSEDTTAAGGNTTTAETTLESTTTAPVETVPPLMEIDLDGYELHMLKYAQEKIAWSSVAFAPEESSSDIIIDDIYNRNLRLMETYGFSLKETEDAAINGQLPALAQSGDTTYQMYYNMLNQIAPMSLTGIFTNLRSVEAMCLDEAWWDQGIVRDLELFGNMFFIAGDVTVSDDDCVQVLFYNKGLAKDLKFDDLYETVRDGKWTVDRMNEMVTAAAYDVNGDGIRDHLDRYGLLGQAGESVNTLFAGAGGRVAKLDEKGVPYIVAGSELSERAASAISALYAIPGGNFNYTTFPGVPARQGIVTMFEDNRCLFYENGISAAAQYMRDVDIEYGFIPCPKLDENQETYLAKVSYSVPVLAMPSQNPDPEKTGLVLEILSRDSGASVMEDYYEVCFSAKFVRDEESYEMLRMAVENHMYDPGNAFDWGGLGSSITPILFGGEDTYMSTVASKQGAAESAIEAMISAFEKTK